MSNVTGDGIWSGRGIAIPVAGAIFGGDDYKEKIGRERIPWWLSDFSGRPSMAADSGWSAISMSRVEKGHDYLNDPQRMFPDQDVKEQDEDNNYSMTESSRDIDLMRRNVLKLYFDENAMIENSRYSLISNSSILHEQITDNIVSNLPEWAQDQVEDIRSLTSEDVYRLLMGVSGELARDVSAILVSGIPIFGTLAAGTFVLTNMMEMRIGQQRGMRAIDNFLLHGTEEYYEEMGEIATLLYDDYVDWLQACLLMVPVIGPTRGFFSFIRSGLTVLKGGKATSFIGLGGGSALSLAVRSQIFANPIFKFVTKFADADLGSAFNLPKATMLNTVVTTPAMLISMGDLMQAYDIQKEEAGSPDGFIFDTTVYGITNRELQVSRDRLQSDTIGQIVDLGGEFQQSMQEFLSKKIEEIRQEVFNEGKEVKSKNLLRQFIRESLYNDIEPLNKPEPAGWVYRNPKSTAEDYSSEDGPYSSQLVQYKADMGDVKYQQRPDDLREEALRRIIRRKIEESKKKRS